MNLMEATIDTMQRLARKESKGKEIDKYWKCVLPEVLDIATNEIFLTLHRLYISESFKNSAFRLARTVPPRNISNLDNAILWLHCVTRRVWLGINEDREFQDIVDQNHGVFCNSADFVHWVKPSYIWLPHSDGIVGQIYHSLVENYKQVFFAGRCLEELMRRGQQNEYIKHTFILLRDSHGMRQEQNESIDWLRNDSRRIAANVGAASDIGEDALQNHLKKLLALPPHLQIQKCGGTGKAIREGAIDIQRKGGKYEHVPFDEDLANTIPAESPTDSPEGIGVEKLQACRSQLEKVLGKGKTKIGRRRFKVMEMLTHTSCQKTIARELNVSEGTITGDIKIIKKARFRIQEILDS